MIYSFISLYLIAIYSALVTVLLPKAKVSLFRRKMAPILWLTFVFFVTGALFFSPDAYYAVTLLDIIKPVFFIALLMVSSWSKLSLKIRYYSVAISLFSIMYFFFSTGELLMYVGLSLSIFVLILLEQYIRKAESSGLKFSFVVIFVLFCVEAILYCDALLFNRPPEDQSFFRFISLLVSSPFLFFFFSKLREHPIRIALSPSAKFQSGVVFIIGCYMLVVALISTLLILMGVDVQSVGLPLLLTIATLLMAVFFFFSSWRHVVTVFIQKHFTKSHFDYRATWMALLDDIDEEKDPKTIIARGLKMMLSALSFNEGAFFSLHNNKVDLIHSVGNIVPPSQFGELFVLQGYLEEHGWIIDLGVFQSHTKDYPAPLVDLGHRWDKGWWLIPTFLGKHLTGFFLLRRPDVSAFNLTWEVRDYMQAISKQVEQYYRSQILSVKATEQAQFAAFYQTSAFVIHDLKNIDAQLGMLSSNAKLYKEDPDFVNDAFQSIDKMHNRLSKTLSQLRSKQAFEQVAGQSVNDWWLLMQNKAKVRRVSCHVNGSLSELIMAPPESLRFISHLIDNAIEACEKSTFPLIQLSVVITDNMMSVSVADNGHGMSSEFMRERLFKPFQTTKGNAGMGLGVFEVKEFVTSIGGSVHVSSHESKGTTFTLDFPIRKNN